MYVLYLDDYIEEYANHLYPGRPSIGDIIKNAIQYDTLNEYLSI